MRKMKQKKLTTEAEKQKRRAEIAEAKLAATVAHVEELKQERKEAVVLTEKEAHCIARLLQGAVFGKNGSVFDGCAFCKFQCNMDGEKGDIAPHYDEIIRKLWKAIRLKDTEKGNAKLREQGFTDEQIAKLREPDFCGRVGYPSYELQNNNANIHRIENRIKDLQRRQEMETKCEAVTTDLYEYKVEDHRCQFVFDGKPEEEVRRILKNNSFKWSPSRGAWVRQASANGMYAARRVQKELDALAVRKEE